MKLFGLINTSVALVILLMTLSVSDAQTVKTLVNFDGTNGSYPDLMAPLQGFDGKLYGATANGGTNTCTLYGSSMSCGVVFKTTTSGTVTVLHNFDGIDGASPGGTLLEDAHGNFYGVTQYGGPNTACAGFGASGCGTVFKITPNGVFTSLYRFCSLTNCADGANPTGGLVLAADGNLYGATTYGGSNYQDCTGYGCGTIFRMTPEGTLTTLYSFAGTDGSFPYAPLVQSSTGILYGVAGGGGANNDGTVFAITASGKLTTLHAFNGTDGMNPSPVIIGVDGNLYGSTTYGGISSISTCSNYGCGVVFKVTPSGKFTILYDFCSQANCADGYVPVWSLFQATDGNLYGNTSGINGTTLAGFGTIFKITTGGTFTNLYTFSGTDGYLPEGAMMQDTNGTLYGTTAIGGTTGNGNIFSLSEGLHPFVETEPTSGKVGSKVIILGNSLKGSTAVSFNGTPATFAVVSNTAITATVPNGATTGYVTVDKSGGRLTSNVPFRIK
jgi:uncharacterized repeat protein (TIGR03803 family)